MSPTQEQNNDIEISDSKCSDNPEQQTMSEDIEMNQVTEAEEPKEETDASLIDEQTERNYRVWKKNTPLYMII